MHSYHGSINFSDADNNEIQLEHEDDVIKHQKYIVFESALVELFTTCSMCGEEAVVFEGGRVVRWCWVNFQCRGVLQF